MLDRFFLLAQKYPIDLINHGIILLPVFIGLSRWAFLSLPLKIFTLYFTAYFVKESITLWYALHSWHTWYIINLFSLVEVTLLGTSYYIAIAKQRYRRAVGMLSAVALLITLLHIPENMPSTVNSTTLRIFSIVTVLGYFTWLITELRISNILVHGLFWISAGLLVYAAGTFFMHLFTEYTFTEQTPDNIFDRYWNINQFFFMLFCVLSAVGLWMSKHEYHL